MVSAAASQRLLPFTDALSQHGDQPKAVIGRACTLFNRTADIWWVAAVFARQNQGSATNVRFRQSRIGAADPFLPVAAPTKRSSLGRLHVHMSSDAAATHGPCMVLLVFALAD